MGRANIYLPDDLEQRVRTAKIPLSEVCQAALLAAVERAEAAEAPLGREVTEDVAAGAAAGTAWAATAPVPTLLRLLRDGQLPEIPRDVLPSSWFSWSDERTLAWEAGFCDAARSAVRAALTADLPAPILPARETPAAPGGVGAGTTPAAQTSGQPQTSGQGQPDLDKPNRDKPNRDKPNLDKPRREDPTGTGTATGTADELPDLGAAGSTGPLGDDSGSFVGVDRDGRRVAFDPHAALRAGKSPLFAVLGPADPRARFTLSIGQDAAARGAAVVVVDLSGALASRARGLGRNVRILQGAPNPLGGLEDLFRGGGNLRGVWEAVAGLSAGGAGLFPGTGSAEDVVRPGYVTVLSPSVDAGLGGLLSAVSAVRTLAGLTAMTEHPRLLQIDLPTGVTVPAPVASLLTRLIGTAREHDVAFGLSAESAETVTGVGGSGALLSTVFGFATTSPVEADRLRDLLGASAPVLLNPPGYTAHGADEAWCVMRDLEGRLGQVHVDTI